MKGSSDTAVGTGRVHAFLRVEVIAGLAAVAALAGIAVPAISGCVEDGRRARAEADVRVLGAAVTSFHKDLGVYPARSDTGVDDRCRVLLSGGAVPAANPFANDHDFAAWGIDATRGDTLDNHLRRNAPGGAVSGAYATTGQDHWRGPYLAGASPLDPWGRPYVVNVISGWFRSATEHKRMFVLSAGPDGVIDTAAAATAATEIAGDDIGVVLAQQR